MQEKSFNTLTVHAGEDLTENFGAVSFPIYTASVFAFSDAEEGAAIHNYQKPGYFYGKLGNPTQDALEKAIAELENGESALAFASGMAAVSGSFDRCKIWRSRCCARFDVFDYNASAIANMSFNHSKVKAVFYPGLAVNQNHEVARKQMKGFGGMITFDVSGIEAGKTLSII